MTTLSSSTPYSMATTAAMRTTLTELLGWMTTSAGLVQTADTGQVDPTTATLPAANVVIGYWVLRFADSSIYFRLDMKTNTTVGGIIVFTLTVGTGSDGAGNITGQSMPATQITTGGQGLSSTTTSYPTYICRTADFFGICWKVGAPVTMPSGLAFAIEKTCDSSGTATTTGYCVSYQTANANATTLQVKVAVRTAAPAQTFTASSSFCAVPGGVTSSTTAAGNKQAYLHAFPIPDVVLSNYLCTYVASEAALSTTSSFVLVGATAHTYIALANSMSNGNSNSASATWGTMMLWE
jgi:hypothetical protein